MSNKVDLGSLEDRVVLTRDQLEEMKRLQDESKHSEGIGMLLEAYINAKGFLRGPYIRDESEYIMGEKISLEAVTAWMRGASPFHLKHMKGLVEELEVDENYLHFVADRDPFTPTEEELEKWSLEKGGVTKLIRFHMGLPLNVYLRESEYVKKNKKDPKHIKSWFPSSRIERMPLGYLYGLANELEIPQDQIEKVCGRDPFTPTDEELERWSEDKKSVGKLLGFYISLRYAIPTVNYIRDVSYPVVQEGLKWGTVHGWFMGNSPFRLKHLKGFVDELEVPEDELETVYGRNPLKVTEEDLEEWNQSREGVGKLLEFYIDLNYGLVRTQYLESNSEYVQSNGIMIGTSYGWFSGKAPFPEEHLQGLAEEIGVPPEQVKRVTEVKLDSLVVEIDRDELEVMREVQETSFSKNGTKTDKGIGMLLGAYINARGDRVKKYLTDSEYVVGEDITPETIDVWMRGRSPFCLKHMKGLVDELRVSEEHLHYVVGRDPFTPTDEELDSWSEDEIGLKELFAFYIELNYGLKFKVYFRDESVYAKGVDVSVRTTIAQLYKKTMSSQNLKGFAEELGVPPGYVERVSGIDLEQTVLEISAKELERMREVQDNSVNTRGHKTDKGVGMLLDAYIQFKYPSITAFLLDSEYAKEEGLSPEVCYGYLNGTNPFRLKLLKGFVDELGVDQEELEYVARRNPFEVTEEELEEWGGDKKGLKELFAFYIDLNHGKPIHQYLREQSKYVRSNKLNHRTVSGWMYGHADFPLQHLKGFAEELGVPPSYVERVSGIDIGGVKSAGEELTEALERYVND